MRDETMVEHPPYWGVSYVLQGGFFYAYASAWLWWPLVFVGYWVGRRQLSIRAILIFTRNRGDCIYPIGAYSKPVTVPFFARGKLRVTPAMAAGVTDHWWTFDELVA